MRSSRENYAAEKVSIVLWLSSNKRPKLLKAGLLFGSPCKPSSTRCATLPSTPRRASPSFARMAVSRPSRIVRSGTRRAVGRSFSKSGGSGKGDRVVLTLPEPDDFVLTFFGRARGGRGTGAPLSAADDGAARRVPRQLVAHHRGFGRQVDRDRQPPLSSERRRNHVASSMNGAASAMRAFFALAQRSRRRDRASTAGDAVIPTVEVGDDDLAFLQFTSGSTSRPKGVMVTHGNLAANAHAIMFDGLRADPERDKRRELAAALPRHGAHRLRHRAASSRRCRWCSCRRWPSCGGPRSWLDAIHRYRGTITFAPNFAYALATQRVTPRADRGLGSLVHARARLRRRAHPGRTAARVHGQVRAVGPQAPSASCPRTAWPRPRSPSPSPISTSRYAPTASTRSAAAWPARAGRRPTATRWRSSRCGRPFPGHRVEIVDETGRALGERRSARSWSAGPSVTTGYFGDDGSHARGLPRRLALHGRPRLLRRRRALRLRPQQGHHHPERPQLLPAGHREDRLRGRRRAHLAGRGVHAAARAKSGGATVTGDAVARRASDGGRRGRARCSSPQEAVRRGDRRRGAPADGPQGGRSALPASAGHCPRHRAERYADEKPETRLQAGTLCRWHIGSEE